MVKHTQTIRQLKQTNYLSVFDYFVGLALKRLNTKTFIAAIICAFQLNSNVDMKWVN